MSKRVNLEDMEKNRINEIRLRALVVKMLEKNGNNFMKVKEYVRSLSKFLDFDADAIIGMMLEILGDRYAPTTNEVIKINLLFGLTIREIATKLNMKESTVKNAIYRNQDNINTIILYPRLDAEQLQELRKFLKQYYGLYVMPTQVIRT